MSKSKLFLAVAVLAAVCAVQVSAQDIQPARDYYEGWKLGPQAYSFNRFTFYEAVDKAAELNLQWIEAYPGQKLSKDKPNVGFGHDMPKELRAEVKQKLADAGVQIIAYGVVGLPNEEQGARKVFEFAKDMGISYIASEPGEDAFDLLDRLAQEYKIYVAIHNHPNPSHYWNPDTVLKVCEGRSKYIGACADTGHWTRSGIDPVEAVKKLNEKGRIVYFHFKDLNEFGNRGAHDVPWGRGESKAREVLEYLHGAGWKGYFSSEYEHNWDNSVPEIRQCVQWFRNVGRELESRGWQPLLSDDLSDAQYKKGAWEMKDGVLARVDKGGDLWTKERYNDFILDFDFKVDPKTNSGVFIRTFDINQWLHTGIEVQIHDSAGQQPGRHGCGAIYDCLAPASNPMKPAGEWNHMTITAEDNLLSVTLNGELIVWMDMNEWPQAHQNPAADKAPNTWPKPDGSKNKFNNAYQNMARVGHIGFQDHGHPVWYRNIRIKKI